MSHADLTQAKRKKKDEFYTTYEDIALEMQVYVKHQPDVFRNKTILLPCDDPEKSCFTKYFIDHFEVFGLKRLISTCFCENACGKLFLLDRNHPVTNPLVVQDLVGNGDFRSDEVTRLRDEADIIITNPPFSLFREFVAWILQAQKQFVILGNVNAIAYKEFFPYLQANQIWLGDSIHAGDRAFYVPDDYPLQAAGYGVDADGRRFIRVKGVRWFTNIPHAGRNAFLELHTREENLRGNRRLQKKLQEMGVMDYPLYDNYDAIEVPFTECIPSDYDGVMGVPITFLDKYNPDQFELVKFRKGNDEKDLCIHGKCPYFRILIRRIL